MGYKRCIDCGEFYYADEYWKVHCVDCWRGRKLSEDSYSVRSTPQERRLIEWGFRLARWEAELKAREVWLEQRTKPVSPGLGPMLSKLLQLCHPDKHKVVHCHSQ